MKKNNPTISLVINTKNEEKNISACILSAKSIVDEIIIVDMHSSDKTVKIARSLGANIYFFEDKGYVEPARNFAIRKANMDWILLLDADERVSKTLKKNIKKIIASKKNTTVIGVPRKNIIFGKWVKGNNYYWPDYQTRLFKNGSVSWLDTIHNPGVTAGKTFYLPPTVENAIEHLVQTNSQRLFEKVDKYSTLDTSFDKYISENGFNSKSLIHYLNHEFLSGYIDKKGYEDGFEGFILYKLMENYRFAEIVKWWIKHKQPDMQNEPDFIKYYMRLSNATHSLQNIEKVSVINKIKGILYSHKFIYKTLKNIKIKLQK